MAMRGVTDRAFRLYAQEVVSALPPALAEIYDGYPLQRTAAYMVDDICMGFDLCRAETRKESIEWVDAWWKDYFRGDLEANENAIEALIQTQPGDLIASIDGFLSTVAIAFIQDSRQQRAMESENYFQSDHFLRSRSRCVGPEGELPYRDAALQDWLVEKIIGGRVVMEDDSVSKPQSLHAFDLLNGTRSCK